MNNKDRLKQHEQLTYKDRYSNSRRMKMKGSDDYDDDLIYGIKNNIRTMAEY